MRGLCGHLYRLGTKGLVLRNGQIVREINRSYYQAGVYDYPVCLWRHGERILLAHCPEHYNQLEIEDAETGERLTAAPDRKPSDFFHSRLQPSPDGNRLLSAGWMWHPLDGVAIFDVRTALTTPDHLDRDALIDQAFEDASACWLHADCVLVCGQGDINAEEPGPPALLAIDAEPRTTSRSIPLERPAGVMIPVGGDAVLAFYEHPRLISLTDGGLLHAWPDLRTTTRISSIDMGRKDAEPVMALDPINRRFAIAQGDDIHVIAL